MKHFVDHKSVKVRGTFFKYESSHDGRGRFTLSMQRETPKAHHYHRHDLELSISDVRCAIRALRQFIKAERTRIAELSNYTGVDND